MSCQDGVISTGNRKWRVGVYGIAAAGSPRALYGMSAPLWLHGLTYSRFTVTHTEMPFVTCCFCPHVKFHAHSKMDTRLLLGETSWNQLKFSLGAEEVCSEPSLWKQSCNSALDCLRLDGVDQISMPRLERLSRATATEQDKIPRSSRKGRMLFMTMYIYIESHHPEPA